MTSRSRVIVRTTTPEDFPGVIALTEATYPGSQPWTVTQLASHLEQFPDGQLVAIERETDTVVGMAASLIVFWDDYDFDSSWRDFTSRGTFDNHDPEHGRTLYGAEVMVSPGRRGLGIGKALYAARRELAQGLKLLRIRAGARLRGYHRVAHRMTAVEYVQRIAAGTMSDPTLSFQLREDFHVLGVAENYLHNDPESLGWAAVIEWTNPDLVSPPDTTQRAIIPAQLSAPGGSSAPKRDTTTRAGAPGRPGTTANSAA